MANDMTISGYKVDGAKGNMYKNLCAALNNYVSSGKISKQVTDNIFSLDDMIMYSYGHSVDRQYTNNAFGINMDFGISPVTKAKEKQGMIFFTRPQLNLTTNNLMGCDTTRIYTNDSTYSTIRYARNMLDPRLEGNGVKCPLVDPKNGFISILSNNCMGMSGFPDLYLRTYVTDRGIKNDQWAMVDSDYVYYEEYDLSAMFFNTKDNITNVLLEMWLRAMGAMYMGTMTPYSDYIVNRTICYNTRIYRVVLDDFNKRVSRIAATGASFPVTINTGTNFDYIKDEVVKGDEQISCQFKALGCLYNDPLLIREFNEVCSIFNPNYRLLNNYWLVSLMLSDHSGIEGEVTYSKLNREIDLRASRFKMRKLHEIYKNLFNNHCYPFINPMTNEFEWYVDAESDYYKLMVKLGVVNDQFLLLYTSYNFNRMNIPTVIDYDFDVTGASVPDGLPRSFTSAIVK
jgi:hypothetical protein